MPRLTPQPKAVTDRMASGLFGLLCLASAAASALLAGQHMALRGAICGAAQSSHCGWCYGAAAFALAGVAALGLTAAPARRLARVTSVR